MTGVALTIRQPWAWLIVHGYKDVENRGWYTPHRGRLWIHAGKATPDPQHFRWLAEEFPAIYNILPPSSALPLGALVGHAELVTCATTHASEWYRPGHFAWVLRDPVVLARVIPMAGRQGLFAVDGSRTSGPSNRSASLRSRRGPT